MKYYFLKKLGSLLPGFLLSTALYAQTNDLMISKYVDWSSGDGYAIEIYNPTSSAINLSAYSVQVFYNGNTTPLVNTTLSGTIAPGATLIAGNPTYCQTECSGDCDLQIGNIGINGNDVVALFKGNCPVDMIGQIGTSINSNQGWMVDNDLNATYKNVLSRNTGHLIRYTSSDGVSSNSWPASKNVSVGGWTVSAVACLSKGFTHSGQLNPAKEEITGLQNGSSFCQQTSLGFTAQQNPGWFLEKTDENWDTTFSNFDTLRYVPYRRGNYRLITLYPCQSPLGDTITFNVAGGNADGINEGPYLRICDPQQDTIITLTTFNDALSYQWSWKNMPSSAHAFIGSFTDTFVRIRFQAMEGIDTIILEKRLAGGCISRSEIALELVSLPDLSLPDSLEICLGDSVKWEQLQIQDVNLNFNPDLFWGWKNPDSLYVNPPQSTEYQLDIEKKGCSRSDMLYVEIVLPPQFSIGPSDTICAGEEIVIRAMPGPVWWSDGSFGDSIVIQPFQSAHYAADYLISPCPVQRDSVWIQVNPSPDATFTYSAPVLKTGEEVLFTAFDLTHDLYRWSVNGNEVSIAPAFSRKFDQSGQMTVRMTVTNEWGCKDSSEQVLLIEDEKKIVMYNVFTPNGDGMNDTFKLQIQGFRSYEVLIYNRWGEKLAELNQNNTSWNGEVNGKAAPNGVYFYIVHAVDFEGTEYEYSGTLTLIR